MTAGESSAEIAAGRSLESLRQMVEAACTALDQAADLRRDVRARQQLLRTAEQRLDAVDRLLERSRRELAGIAAELVRASLPEGACGAPWPDCARCLGVGLVASAGTSWCPSCGSPDGPTAAGPAYLCPERATVTVRDAGGAEQALCLSHAAGALRRIDQVTVVRATPEEVRRLAVAQQRPLRVELTAGRRPPRRWRGRAERGWSA
jgi:hypothetical protein